MTPAAQSLLAELDTTLVEAPPPWRQDALRRIVDLFLSGAAAYSEEQVALFDEVMCRLVQNLDRTALAELGGRLAAVEAAPARVLGMLARHIDIAVCGPVLAHAKGLPDADLAEIAGGDRTDPKLLAKIADRAMLSGAITDILLKRGDAALQRKLVGNPEARISAGGFARLVSGINGDKDLAAAIAGRDDLPDELRPWLDKVLTPAEA